MSLEPEFEEYVSIDTAKIAILDVEPSVEPTTGSPIALVLL